MDTSSNEDKELVARHLPYPLVSQVEHFSTPSKSMQLYSATHPPNQTTTKLQPEKAMVAYQYKIPPTETAMLPMDKDFGIIKRGTPEKKTVRRLNCNANKAKLKLNKKSPESPATNSPPKKSPALANTTTKQ